MVEHVHTYGTICVYSDASTIHTRPHGARWSSTYARIVDAALACMTIRGCIAGTRWSITYSGRITSRHDACRSGGCLTRMYNGCITRLAPWSSKLMTRSAELFPSPTTTTSIIASRATPRTSLECITCPANADRFVRNSGGTNGRACSPGCVHAVRVSKSQMCPAVRRTVHLIQALCMILYI